MINAWSQYSYPCEIIGTCGWKTPHWYMSVAMILLLLFFSLSSLLLFFSLSSLSATLSSASLFPVNPFEKCQACVPYHGVGLNSNQIVVCYSYTFCTTIVPVYTAWVSPLYIQRFEAGLMFTCSSGGVKRKSQFHEH